MEEEVPAQDNHILVEEQREEQRQQNVEETVENPVILIEQKDQNGDYDVKIEAFEQDKQEEGDEEEEEENKNDQSMIKEEFIKKEEQKRKKRKPKKKKQIIIEKEPETDYEGNWRDKIKESKIFEDPNLPQNIKEKYATLECNPLAMVVSNVPPNTPLKGLEAYFNTLITSLNVKVGDRKPVVKIEYGMIKSWIVLELSNREAKQTLAPLEYLEYINCKLRVEKPKKFLQRILNAMTDVRSLHQDSQQKERIRLYIGGLPLYLNDDDIRKLVSAFGPVAYFNLVKDTTNRQQPQSKGYAFFEYENPASANKALKALNGLQIADKRIKVTRVQLPRHVDRGTSQPSNHAGSFLASSELLRIPEVQMMLTIPPNATIASKVVQFLNMVSPEDLFDDDVHEELLHDLRAECSLYGNVDKVEIPRPDKETGFCSPAVGKCFVKFFYQIPAKKCKYYLAGRTYNKRTVITAFYPEDRFDLKDYLING